MIISMFRDMFSGGALDKCMGLLMLTVFLSIAALIAWLLFIAIDSWFVTVRQTTGVVLRCSRWQQHEPYEAKRRTGVAGATVVASRTKRRR